MGQQYRAMVCQMDDHPLYLWRVSSTEEFAGPQRDSRMAFNGLYVRLSHCRLTKLSFATTAFFVITRHPCYRMSVIDHKHVRPRPDELTALLSRRVTLSGLQKRARSRITPGLALTMSLCLTYNSLSIAEA